MNVSSASHDGPVLVIRAQLAYRRGQRLLRVCVCVTLLPALRVNISGAEEGCDEAQATGMCVCVCRATSSISPVTVRRSAPSVGEGGG